MRATQAFSVVAYGWLASSSISRSLFTSSFTSFVTKKTGRKICDLLLASMSSVSVQEVSKPKKKMPITVLSGFLGAGKTSFLQHALENDQGLRYGLIVNDVAEVNVDSKLIRKKTIDKNDGIDTLELQNGCVCCTLAEDMLMSISKLISISTIKGIDYDHIIVECSGIAEPRKIRDLFQEAEDYQSLIVESVKLDTLITLVDAKLFVEEFGTDTKLESRSELAVSGDDKEGLKSFQNDGAQRQITELLLEQVECADVILINKCDLLTDPINDLKLVKDVIKKINPRAKVFTCVYGKAKEALKLLGSAEGKGAADFGVLDEHRMMLEAATKEIVEEQHHSHAHAEIDCVVQDCKDPTHNHDHSHAHSESDCVVLDCKDPTHKHDHSHSHAEADCMVPDCNDPTHNHDHSHSHAHHDATTAETRFGITSLVYRRRRPFHPVRFSLFLNGIGQLSVQGIKEISSFGGSIDEPRQHPLLRSKGFVWMGTSPHAAYFMSHAGQYLELSVLGRWWADIEKDKWPPGGAEEIMGDFEGPHGDRRQELVFIGQFQDSNAGPPVPGDRSKKALERVLDSCLLTDAEMAAYEREAPKGEEALRKLFFSTESFVSS